MLTSRRPRLPAPQKPRAQPAARRKIAAIEADRDRLLTELAQLANTRGRSTRPLETARALLMRSWARADWREREELIKAASWMISLECQREK